MLFRSHVAMGQSGSRYPVGIVRAVGHGGWAWLVRGEVAEARRVAALDGLDALRDGSALRAWATEWAGAISTLAP